MNLAELFIRRPIMTTLAMLAILIFGIIAYRVLPVSDLPNVDYPTLMVSAALPGASPETMAAAVATPLEREFSTIAGLESMSSMSTLGGTQITLQFSLSRNIDAASQDVQAAIARSQGRLPPDMPAPPAYRKVNPADQPIIYMAVYSDTLPLSTVNEYADTLMAQRISMISGVAQVQLYGAQKYAVRVQLDPQALATRGIGIDEVTDAIKNANVNLPTGTLFGTHKSFVVQANGQLHERRRLPAAHRRLSQRCAGASGGAGAGDRQRAEQQGRHLVQRQPCHGAGHPAPARHQHRGSGGQHPATAAHVPQRDSTVHSPRHALTTARLPFATQ